MSKKTDGVRFDHADWVEMTGSPVIRTGTAFVRPTRKQYEDAARRKLATAGVAKAAPAATASTKASTRRTARPLLTAAEGLAMLDASDRREAKRADNASPLSDVTATWRAAGSPATALEARKQYHPPAVVHGWLRAGLLTQ